jgi:glycosyltransferase involved in cell wall biosynthesis
VPVRKHISIVIPAYNESKNLLPLYTELQAVTATLPYEFELIFVDDGSRDNTAEILYKLSQEDRRINFIQLARNFGKEPAVTAGLHAANGDAAIVIDADMQMPPSIMGEFLKKWEHGAEVVVGVFASRSMSPIRAAGAKLFYRIMRSIAHTKITPHATDYRLLDRQVLDEFNALTERNRITRGLIDWLGFKREYVYFQQAPRLHGEPTYSFAKLVTLAINSFTSYSLLPLKLAGYLGAFILMTSIPAGCNGDSVVPSFWRF